MLSHHDVAWAFLRSIPRQRCLCQQRRSYLLPTLPSQFSPRASPNPNPNPNPNLNPNISKTNISKTKAIASRPQIRFSSSSTRWKNRQGRDSFAREAKVQGLKSRAAFKLLEIDAKYKLFKTGQTVVDLGYAPGSWSQVAVERTKPSGRILGIDIIPAQPPKGVSTIQGNFLSPHVQAEVKRFLGDPNRGRPIQAQYVDVLEDITSPTSKDIGVETPSYIDLERLDDVEDREKVEEKSVVRRGGRKKLIDEEKEGRMVDVVLSDMSAPWDQTTGFWKRSLSDPYYRMMNTSGINFKDHAGSMDLCAAALRFAFDTLRTGGHFVCKFYQGGEDKLLEAQLRTLFGSVHREKPESSRSESKEAFFVALRRKGTVSREDVWKPDPDTVGFEDV